MLSVGAITVVCLSGCMQDFYLHETQPAPATIAAGGIGSDYEWLAKDIANGCKAAYHEVELTPDSPVHGLEDTHADAPRYIVAFERYGDDGIEVTFAQGRPEGIIMEYAVSSNEVVRTPYDIVKDQGLVFFPAVSDSNQSFDSLQKITICY